MEILIFLVLFTLALLYIFKPITKQEEDSFKNNNNWQGGF